MPAVLLKPPASARYRDALLNAGGLAGYWPLSEFTGTLARDLSRNGNNGTYTNAPILGQPGVPFADPDGAATFAFASSQYVQCKSGRILQGIGDFTVIGWFKVASGYATHDIAIYSERAASGNDIFKMEVGALNYAQHLHAVYRDDAGTLHFTDGATNVCDGLWHMGAWRLSGTTFQLFLDGVANGSPVTRTATLTLTNASTQCRIGADAGDGNAYFEGSLSQVALFSRAVDAAQLRYLWSLGIG